MREIRQSGSEGGAERSAPTPNTTASHRGLLNASLRGQRPQDKKGANEKARLWPGFLES